MGEDESKVLAWLKDRYCGNPAGLAYDLFMLAFGSLAVGLCLSMLCQYFAV